MSKAFCFHLSIPRHNPSYNNLPCLTLSLLSIPPFSTPSLSWWFQHHIQLPNNFSLLSIQQKVTFTKQKEKMSIFENLLWARCNLLSFTITTIPPSSLLIHLKLNYYGFQITPHCFMSLRMHSLSHRELCPLLLYLQLNKHVRMT